MSVYQKYTSLPSQNKYKSLLELGVRTFIKDVVNNRNGVGIHNFNNYSSIRYFINKFLFETGLDLRPIVTSKYISGIKLLSKGKIPKLNMVPRSLENLKFFDYVKSVFAGYDVNKVLKKV